MDKVTNEVVLDFPAKKTEIEAKRDAQMYAFLDEELFSLGYKDADERREIIKIIW